MLWKMGTGEILLKILAILGLNLFFFQGEGEFKGLEGIAVNSKGNILVADRENHRVQIF